MLFRSMPARRPPPPPRPGATVTIHPRGPRWQVQYVAADETYARRLVRTRALAASLAARIQREADEAMILGRPPPRPLTLGELAERQMERGGRKRSIAHDRGRWAVILACLGRGRSVASIRSTDVDILRELEPLVAREVDRHIAKHKDWHPHDYVPWAQGRNFPMLGGEA